MYLESAIAITASPVVTENWVNYGLSKLLASYPGTLNRKKDTFPDFNAPGYEAKQNIGCYIHALSLESTCTECSLA